MSSIRITNSMYRIGTSQNYVEVDPANNVVTIMLNGTKVFKFQTTKVEETLPIKQVETIT